MSAVRCREGRLGKFTRPKEQWSGRRRGAHRDAPNAFVPAAFQMQAQIGAANIGKLMFQRKAGGS
jgi:hypothetical protein